MKHSVSGPCGVIIEWRDAPPGRKPPSLASYEPRIRPINSLMQFPVARKLECIGLINTVSKLIYTCSELFRLLGLMATDTLSLKTYACLFSLIKKHYKINNKTQKISKKYKMLFRVARESISCEDVVSKRQSTSIT